VDTDEIARPEAVSWLRRCYPFARAPPNDAHHGASGRPAPERHDSGTLCHMIGLEARPFTYGVHCRPSSKWYGLKAWSHGPHAFAVSFLNRTFGPAALAARLATKQRSVSHGGSTSHHPTVNSAPTAMAALARAFSETRSWSPFRCSFMRDAAWHLSYFGTAAQLATKFQTCVTRTPTSTRLGATPRLASQCLSARWPL
jgi:hypothetical protein